MDNSSDEDVDSSLDPVTDELRDMFELINYVILCGIISLFGVGANIVIILVLVRQGFKDSINISLLGLAIADLACSITMLWTGICHNPFFQGLDLPFDPTDIMFATGGMPHECFNRVTSSITAFITLERCLCIAMPLKVKNIITPFRTKFITVSILLLMFLLFCPFYFVHTLDWKYHMSRNRSILTLTYRQDREIVDSVTFFIHSVFLSSTLLLSVIVCTIILVIKLNQKTKWRKEAVAQTVSKPEMISVKDKKVVKMITLISTIYIACNIPPAMNFLVMVLHPDYNYSGCLHNLLFVSWSVAFVLESINSSVNIFVYYNMSTKFKDTLGELLFSSKMIVKLNHESIYLCN